MSSENSKINEQDPEIELDFPEGHTSMTTVQGKTKSHVTMSESGFYIYDTRKEKNRALGKELIIGSKSQEIDFFKIIQKSDGFYLTPLQQHFKYFTNIIDISIDDCYGPLKDGDIISADKYKYIINTNAEMTADEAKKTVGKFLVSSSSTFKSKELSLKEKDFENAKIQTQNMLNQIEEIKLLGQEYKENHQKIQILNKRCQEIEGMNLQEKYNQVETQRKKWLTLANQLQSDIAQIKNFIEKNKKLDQNKQEVQIKVERERILSEEQELLERLEKIKEAKKKLGAA